MPVRQIPIGTRALTGRHARTGAKYESGLERDFFELVSQDPLFDAVDWQPVKIRYTDIWGKLQRYTPDALVTFKTDPVSGIKRPPLLAEVKYREEYRARYHELKDRLRAARRYADSLGWQFEVVTEREIRTARFANRYFLNGYLERAPASAVQAAISDEIARGGEIDIRSLLSAVTPDKMRQAELLPSVWWMLARGHIETDLSVRLNMRAVVRLPDSARI